MSVSPEGCLAVVDARMAAIVGRFDAPALGTPNGEPTFESLLGKGLGTPPVPAAATAHGRAGFTPAIERAIALAARESGVEPSLLRAVVSVESGGDPAARSAAGARGLMQLMPATARALGVDDPDDPEQNVRGGARYLRSLLDRFGDVRSAVAGYNAGPSAVERAGGVPPFEETRRYVERVIAAWRPRAP